AEGKREPGQWSGKFRGVHSKVPAGGITAKLIRKVHIGVAEAGIHKLQESIRDTGAENSNQPFKPAAAIRTTRGRKSKADVFYVKLARAYVERCKVSRTPVADLARSRKVSQAKIRDALRSCRERAFLTYMGRGRKGGELTPEAMAVLSSSQERSS